MENPDIAGDDQEQPENVETNQEFEPEKDKATDMKNIIAMGKPKPFEKKILEEYTPFDMTSFTMINKIAERKEKAPKT